MPIRSTTKPAYALLAGRPLRQAAAAQKTPGGHL
jgi:hypothetical protein